MKADTPSWPYGRVLARYEGYGRLVSASGQAACAFDLIQLTTGRLVMACRLQADRLIYGWVGKSTDLRGETETGEEVSVRGAFVRSAQPMPDDGGWVTNLKLTCRRATVVGRPEGPTDLRYGLTNLQLDGNDGYREDFPDGRFRLGQQSRFGLEGFEVTIRSLPGVEELLEEVEELRGIGVTAEATVVAGLGQRDSADDLMDKLCLLLSLSLGRGVVWVYRKAVNVDQHVVEAFHLNAKTKPWSNHQLVPTERIEAFVAATYPTLLAEYERWGLRDAIRAYIDALVESDYLEFRALKLVVVVEYLRKRYCEGRGETWFRKGVARMCSALCVPMSEEDLDLLKKARNKLVHEATFLKEEASPSVHEQYLFLVAVVGRALLGTLGYEGDWYDWRGASNGNGPRRAAFRLAPKPEVRRGQGT